MGVQDWKRIIAIFVVVAFIGIGVAWAMEQGSPQFQEKAGTPVVKKHKKFPWLIALLGVAVVGVGVYFLTKKKNNSGGDYTITLQNKDVVTDAAVNGNLAVKLANGTIVNGTSGGQFKLIDSNSISDIVVTDAAGHYTGYAVFTDSDGNVVAFKDRDGMNKSFTVADGKQYFVRLISDAVDTKLLAKCVGNVVNLKDLGDGTIINYNTSDGNVNGVVQVKVAIMKADSVYGEEPTDTTVGTFKRAIDILNAIPHNRVQLVYTGIVTSMLSDGLTFKTAKVSPSGGTHVINNTAIYSFFQARADTDLMTLVEETLNNGTGIFFDAGDNNPYDGGRSPYIGGNANNPVWLHNAEYAIALSDGALPRGFKLSTTSVPASQLPSPMSTGSTREYSSVGSASKANGRGRGV